MTNYHKKILIISPHLDDEVLGCGGTIQYFKKIKSEVNVIFIADRKYNNKIISHKIKSITFHIILYDCIKPYPSHLSHLPTRSINPTDKLIGLL